jgi:hypothetical protein
MIADINNIHRIKNFLPIEDLNTILDYIKEENFFDSKNGQKSVMLGIHPR